MGSNSKQSSNPSVIMESKKAESGSLQADFLVVYYIKDVWEIWFKSLLTQNIKGFSYY